MSPAGGKGALRALYRLERFRLAAAGHSLWAVRRSLPVLSRQNLLRLPHDLRASHGAWPIRFPIRGRGGRWSPCRPPAR